MKYVHIIFFVKLIILLIAFWIRFTHAADTHKVYREVSGQGELAVVFINGNATTLESWSKVESKVRQLEVKTFRSNRDGFGGTPIGPRPYNIFDEITVLESALLEEGFTGPTILVAHSYGGLLAAILAEKKSNVIGVVLVDALIPEEMTSQFIDSTLKTYRPQYEAVRKQAPQIAEAIIPVVEAFPQTSEALSNTRWPFNKPIISIRAQTSNDPEDIRVRSNTHHQQLVATAPKYRKLILASGSGHQVMDDRPDIVIDAITELIKEFRLN